MSFNDDDNVSNPTSNKTFAEVLEVNMQRRRVLQGGFGAAAAGFFGGSTLMTAIGEVYAKPVGSKAGAVGAPKIGFQSVDASLADTVRVPEGYRWKVLNAWGDPIATGGKAFGQDASETAAEQELQSGMHHDGMHYFPFPPSGKGAAVDKLGNRRGLLVVNHEYTDDGLLHVGGFEPWTAEKVRKSQAAHGVSVMEIEKDAQNDWKVKVPSAFGRRVTGYTPIAISGPAAGHPLMQTAADPAGRTVLGTLNNCAHGYTPWGTYLACEENWNGYFVNRGVRPPEQIRYGVSANGFGYRWHEHDERFDAELHPNETNRFGWVVEIDPWNPDSMPVKRTALGRIKHEGAWITVAKNGQVVAYTGDDERFEYIYKFVSRYQYNPNSRAANRDLLDEGTLYVAKFNDDGTGQWLALEYGMNGLTPANGFNSQAEVLIKTRQAADRAGATRMDRPEWIAVHPDTQEVYCALTNNSARTAANVDAANPRGQNVFGHIIRWREAGGDATATTFEWDIFVNCGDPANPDPNKQGDIVGDIYGSPDGLWFDNDGRLWIQTDISTNVVGRGDYINIGNNQMLCADPVTGETRRFLTGPRGCEVTGVITTPDQTAMFVNIQHPGEPAGDRNDPGNPKAVSSWPDGDAGTRPRSSTVVIWKEDGGVIGT
jgi:uncharacterized protein